MTNNKTTYNVVYVLELPTEIAEKASSSGRKKESGPRGGIVTNPKKINVSKGRTLPATPVKTHTWSND